MIIYKTPYKLKKPELVARPGDVVWPPLDGYENPDVEEDHAPGRDVEVDDGSHSLEGHVGREFSVTHRVWNVSQYCC